MSTYIKSLTPASQYRKFNSEENMKGLNQRPRLKAFKSSGHAGVANET